MFSASVAASGTATQTLSPTCYSPKPASSSSSRHELNLADWLNLTPSHPLFVTSSPPALDLSLSTKTTYKDLISSATNDSYNQSSDFLTCAASPAAPTSPFTAIHASAHNAQASLSSLKSVSLLSTQTSFLSSQDSTSSVILDNDPSSRQSTPQLFPIQDSHNFGGLSPLNRHFDTSSTPVTTICADDDDVESVDSTPVPKPRDSSTDAGVHECTADKSTTDTANAQATAESEANRSFMDLLRNIPDPRGTSSSASHAVQDQQHPSPSPASVLSHSKHQNVISLESPFRIAQPQPRLHNPIGSSPLSLLVTPASDRSGASTPLEHSRPSSAASNHGRNTPRRQGPLPPRRFQPSLLRVNLNHWQLTPSFADALAQKQRGPLEYEKDGHRYRTRSKLRTLKAEMEERERHEDLSAIRRALGKEEEPAIDGADETLPRDELGHPIDKAKSEEIDHRLLSASPAPPLTAPTRLKEMANKMAKNLVSKSKSPSPAVVQPRPRRESARVSKRTIKELEVEPTIARRPTPAKRQRSEGKAAGSGSSRDTSVAAAATTTRPSRAKGKAKAKAAADASAPASPALVVVEPPSTPKCEVTSDDVHADNTASTSMSQEPVPIPNSELVPTDQAPSEYETRTFPEGVPVHPAFPLLYRRFPLCSYLDPAVESYPKPSNPPPGGHFNAPRSVTDLYTPRYVRGVGRDKAGLCPICYESRERGGKNKTEWLSMKFSAFNYHMQYAHGISPTTTLPFSPPLAYRLSPRKQNHKNEKAEILEGLCHKCKDWAPVEGVKCVEAKLKEIYWWKHAAQCHKGSIIEGETDAHLEDELTKAILQAAKAAPLSLSPKP